MKPILFNTEMVKAILDDKKTVTRRVVKVHNQHNSFSGLKYLDCAYAIFSKGRLKGYEVVKAPCQPGDILYVRETWARFPSGAFAYKANYIGAYGWGWKSPICMPKEAARIFLRVTDVRVEMLQDITVDGCRAEGIWDDYKASSKKYHESLVAMAYPKVFASLWDSTIKPKDRALYGWEANPWVWVIEFENMENAK